MFKPACIYHSQGIKRGHSLVLWIRGSLVVVLFFMYTLRAFGPSTGNLGADASNNMHCCLARERLINILILILILILKRVISFSRCYVITETDWIATILSYHGNFFNHYYISTKISWVNSFWALEFPKCPVYNRRNLQRDYSRVFIGWGLGRRQRVLFDL